jgi:hypothetical protein
MRSECKRLFAMTPNFSIDWTVAGTPLPAAHGER